jgi:hypothetical protein
VSPAAEQLEVRVAAVRGYLRRRAALGSSLWVAGGIGALLLVAWIFAGSDGWPQGSDVPLLVDVLIALWIVGALALHGRSMRRWFHEVPLSHSIEGAVGLRRGIVRGTLELGRAVPAGVSSTLATRAVLRTVMDLEGRNQAELAGELGSRVALWTRRGLGFAAMFAVVLTAVAVLWPGRTARAWAGVASPFATMVDPVLAPIVVRPGDVEVLRGTDVQLAIDAQGRANVVLAWQAAGEVARRESLPVREGRASHVFEAVGATIEYRVRGESGYETETYRIVPIDPLFVSDLTVGVVYPPHTGIPPEEYRGDPPPLRLPVGSSLTFDGYASRPLSRAQLIDTAGAAVLALEVDETAFTGAWRPTRNGSFAWDFLDRTGSPAEIQPAPIEILMVADSAPVVTIPLPGRDTILPLNLRQPLVLEAHDDYGLRRLELVAYRVTAFGERLEPLRQGLDLGGTRAALARPLLDLTTWGLLPGDTVRYYATTVDNAPVGQVGRSREYVLRMPAAAELRREAESALEGAAERLEELASEAARQAEENRDQALESAAQPSNDEPRSRDADEFEEREELRAALEEQAGLTTEVDSLRAELEALERMLEEAGQADPELRAELDELQELLRETAGEDLQRRMEELAEALEQDDMRQANQSLEDLAAEQEMFRQRLEESIERFKRAAVEQDFRATTSEAEELARQEQALADAMREADAPELRAQQQEELADRAEQLESQMERLEDRLRELGEEEAAEGVEQARERSQASREQMQQAQQQVEQGENRQGGERAQEAAEQMQEAAEQLAEAQQEMAQDQMEEQVAALQRTADDALSLARRQSELREQMRGAGEDELAQMRGDQASVLRGVQNVAENLQIATEGAMGANNELSAQIGRTMQSVQETLEAMETRGGATPSPVGEAEEVVGDLNQLAMMAIAVADQMGQPGTGQSGDEVGEQLEQLAQEQGELMNQSGQLMPMQLGEQAMSQQLQQMSQGQQSVASDLGELADEPGSADALGDLRELAAEAELLSQQLAQGRLTPDVVQRQERLFHRLLDAGRSLEREEFSEERESEVPGAFERGEVAPLTAEQLGAMPYRLPDPAQLQGLAPAVRQLVLEYFERLNRARPGSGGSR